MDMVKALLLAAASLGITHAADFSLNFGPPVAAGMVAKNIQSKGINTAVRAENCSDPNKAALTGTAEGIDKGVRRSIPLVIVEANTNVFAILANWPADGSLWLLNVTGTCGTSASSATVAANREGPLRDTIKRYSKKPTPAEIEADLKALVK
jgi:hypothetical protein